MHACRVAAIDPQTVEFVYRERFTITCKVCTRPDYNLTVTGLQWSRQEGNLPEDVRVGVLDLDSWPAQTSLVFSIPTAEDAGVYKCTPTVLQIPSSEIDKYIGYTVVKEGIQTTILAALSLCINCTLFRS